jgi:hypothetical protein
MFPVALSLISMQIGAGKNRARDDNEKEAESSERCEKGRQAKINCRLKDLKFVLGGEINSITVPARSLAFLGNFYKIFTFLFLTVYKSIRVVWNYN